MNDLLSAVSLRRLYAFTVVCRTLHVARAAEELGIAQPALSQQIIGLERAVGAKLFNRRKRGIDMTVAGDVLHAEANRILALHSASIDMVRRVARGDVGSVALGYVGSAMFEPYFPDQLKRINANFPEIKLSLREGSVISLVGAVLSGELDVALVRAPLELPKPLVHRVHSRQKLVVIVPAGHLLAQGEKLSIAELSGHPMIGFPDSEDVGIMRVAATMARSANITLSVQWQVTEVGSVQGLVAAGLGFGIVPENFARLIGPEIAVRSLDDDRAEAELWLVWHPERQNPALERFFEVVDTSRTETRKLK